MIAVDEILSRFANVRETGAGKWQADCPAHDDNRPSLSISQGDDGKLLVKCHANCATPDVLSAVGLTLADLFPASNGNGKPRGKFSTGSGDKWQIANIYEYRLADGNLNFEVVRFLPKDFRQRQPDGNGGWKYSVKGLPRTVYKLPELIATECCDRVFIVEGEKDANRLWSMGLPATCNSGGAGKWTAEHATYLKGRNVVILPDNDDAGREHAKQVAASLVGIAASIKIVELLDLPPKGDVSDYLDGGGTVGGLQYAADIAPEWSAPAADSVPEDLPEQVNDELPSVLLPGGSRTISAAATEFAELLAKRGEFYVRGGNVSRIDHDDTNDPVLRPVKPAEFSSDVERVAKPVRITQSKGVEMIVPANCSESASKLILAAESFRSNLPKLRLLSRCPVLIERDGQLVEVVGFDEKSGVLAYGEKPDQLSIVEAKAALLELVRDFRFASASDKSRALAAIVTPAMVFGGLLPGRAPVDLGEADESQTGKGYRNRVTAAVYRHKVTAVNQSNSSIGSLEESFDRALIAGQTFLAFDNIRGRIDSPKVESFLTEDVYYARCAYTPNTEIQPHRVYVMFTSNKADLTIDLANRSSCVRILKQPDDYEFRKFSDGDLLTHVRLNQKRYLGAVFAVIREWHKAGKPTTKESRHDFRAWARSLDWIVQNILGEAPLMDGHRETQQRMATPDMTWLREVVIAAAKHGRTRTWLRAADLIDVMESDGLDVPGLRDGSLEDDGARKQVLQQIGKKLKRCFSDRVDIDVDGLKVEREPFTDEEGRPRYQYRILPSFPPDVPPDRPLMNPLIVSRSSPDPPDDSYKRVRTRAHAHAHESNIGDHQGVQGERVIYQGDASGGRHGDAFDKLPSFDPFPI